MNNREKYAPDQATPPQFSRCWSAHVDALERHLDRMDRLPPKKSKPKKKTSRPKPRT